LNFLVSRWIEKQTQTGTARQFVHETTKSGEKGEEGTRFEVTKDGIWLDDGTAGREGKTLVQMGTMRIQGLPSFDNDILRLTVSRLTSILTCGVSIGTDVVVLHLDSTYWAYISNSLATRRSLRKTDPWN
jgi:hypothetical protein